MDRKVNALLGTAAAAAVATCMQSAPALAAASFADLLEPVSNAVEALKADDARLQASQPAERVQLAQYYDHHHHHHHHHQWGGFGFYAGPRYYHHHHHHGYFRRYYDHHHHHHHHRYYRYYR